MAETALVERIEVHGGRLEIQPGAAVRELLAADLWVTYPASLDLAAVPRSVLLQTAAYLLAPIVWAHDLDVFLSCADTSVADALPRIQAEVRRMYPALPWGGHVRTVDAVPPARLASGPTGLTGLMFSGGVDSMASALRHADGELLLLTIALDDDPGPPARRERTIGITTSFASLHGHRHLLIATNARSMVPKATTRLLRPTVQHWWSEVAHALSLAGLAAPALWSTGAERLLIASSDIPGHDARWGSSARLDPLIGLGPIVVEHDGHDGERLTKVERIVASVGPGGSQDLRVCFRATPDDRLNCGVCEKCLRTQAALVLSDADLARFGFPDPVACALAQSPDDWNARAAEATRGTIDHWATMGRAARRLDPMTRPPATRALLAWLATLEARRPPLGDPLATEPRERPPTPNPTAVRAGGRVGIRGQIRRFKGRLGRRR